MAAEVEQVRLVEEKQKQIMATREIEKFRERVSWVRSICLRGLHNCM